jgi:hypothetical protein
MDTTVNAPVTSPRSDWWRRGARTLIQLLAAGGFTWLTDQLAKDIPTVYVPYLMGTYTVLVALAQNALEDAGKIPAVLKGQASSGADPAPEPARRFPRTAIDPDGDGIANL